MALDGQERQVDVLAVAESTAGRDDLGQDGGEFRRHRPAAGMLAVLVPAVGLGHAETSDSAWTTTAKSRPAAPG